MAFFSLKVIFFCIAVTVLLTPIIGDQDVQKRPESP